FINHFAGKSRIASPPIMANRRHTHPDVAEPYRRWSKIGSSKQSTDTWHADPDTDRLGEHDNGTTELGSERQSFVAHAAIVCLNHESHQLREGGSARPAHCLFRL